MIKIYRVNKEQLDFQEVKYWKPLLVFFAVLILILLSSFISREKTETKYIKTETEVNLVTNNSFSRENLIKEIQRLPFKYRDVILAQCILESGNFKSPVFKQCNNLLGLREAKQRLTLATGTHLNHATFTTWKECLLDRLIFEAKYMHDLSRSEYTTYLGKVYAEAGGYDKVLEQIVKKNKLKEKFE
jgi:uncharacterized FlgJ-related protein